MLLCATLLLASPGSVDCLRTPLPAVRRRVGSVQMMATVVLDDSDCAVLEQRSCDYVRMGTTRLPKKKPIGPINDVKSELELAAERSELEALFFQGPRHTYTGPGLEQAAAAFADDPFIQAHNLREHDYDRHVYVGGVLR